MFYNSTFGMYNIINPLNMLHLLKPSIIKSLNFNEKEESLEIELRKGVKTANHINIPLSIIKDYINSVKENILLENKENNQSNLRIVYSNFKVS
jgi:hypothetical protein